MTYKEKWIEEHPGVEFDPYFVCTRVQFEGRPGVEKKCTMMTCEDCWNREFPYAHIYDHGTKPIAKVTEVVEEKDGITVYAEPTIKDSGDRTEFETGAVRDMREGKGRCDLMPLEVVANFICDTDEGANPVITCIREFQKTGDTHYLYTSLAYFDEHQWDNCYTLCLEVAKHFEEGAKKYGENNWQKGIPVHCYIDSAIRHYLKWLRGDNDEPHDRAFVWNIMCCIWEVDHHKKEGA